VVVALVVLVHLVVEVFQVVDSLAVVEDLEEEVLVVAGNLLNIKGNK
jgi:hypothetical protein